VNDSRDDTDRFILSRPIESNQGIASSNRSGWKGKPGCADDGSGRAGIGTSGKVGTHGMASAEPNRRSLTDPSLIRAAGRPRSTVTGTLFAPTPE